MNEQSSASLKRADLPPGYVGLRRFAKDRSVTLRSVQKAIANGRVRDVLRSDDGRLIGVHLEKGRVQWGRPTADALPISSSWLDQGAALEAAERLRCRNANSPSDARGGDGDMAQRVAALEAEVACLREQVRKSFDSSADESQLAFIEAVHDAFGWREFLTHDLLAASLRPTVAGGRLRPLLDGKSVKSVGRLLSGIATRRTSAGLVLRQVDTRNGYAIWRLSSES